MYTGCDFVIVSSGISNELFFSCTIYHPFEYYTIAVGYPAFFFNGFHTMSVPDGNIFAVGPNVLSSDFFFNLFPLNPVQFKFTIDQINFINGY